jgi:DNA-binding sugar fermentation-stimulating protein
VDHNDIAVCANPNTANTIMRTVLTDNLLPSVFGHVDSVASEVTFASSRFDFVVNERRIIEVKCAPVVDYHPSDPHPFLADTPMSSTLLRDDYRRKAIFPDGFQKKKGELVSERAYKHLVDMVQLVAEGYTCFIVFVVPRNDVHSFSANWERDAGYAAQLKVAAAAGVKVVALCVRWNDRGECLFDHLLDVQIDCPDNLDEVRELRKAARKAVMQAARKREVTEDEPADNGDQLEHAEAEVDRGGVAQPSNSGEPAQPEVVSKGRRRVARRRTK